MRESIDTRLEQRIRRKRGDVFLRADFADLGGYDQVGRALLRLVRAGKLIKLGQGLYARTRPSVLGGSPVPVRDLRTLADRALRRLGVKTAPTRLERDYSAGRTTQMPSGQRIAVGRRVRRKIGFNGIEMSFERARSSSR